MWIQLAVLVIAAILSYALTPKPQVPPAATLDDANIPTTEIGVPVGVVFGEVWIDDSHILWYGDLQNQQIHASGSGGGSFSGH
jgi:hypothetical protein